MFSLPAGPELKRIGNVLSLDFNPEGGVHGAGKERWAGRSAPVRSRSCFPHALRLSSQWGLPLRPIERPLSAGPHVSARVSVWVNNDVALLFVSESQRFSVFSTKQEPRFMGKSVLEVLNLRHFCRCIIRPGKHIAHWK